MSYNYTYLLNETVCGSGLGCMALKLNDAGNGWPFMVIFVMTYIVLTFGLIKNNNHFVKSFTASTYAMLMVAIVAFVYSTTEHMIMNPRYLMVMIIMLAIMAAINTYLSRRY